MDRDDVETGAALFGRGFIRGPPMTVYAYVLLVILASSQITNSDRTPFCPENCVCEVAISFTALGFNVVCEEVKVEDILQKLPSRVFSLGIHRSNISELPSDLFSSVPSLDIDSIKSLDLSDNSIAKVNADVFDPLVNIERLNLSSNHIASISENLFRKLPKLHMLDLSINTLHEEGLVGLNGIKSLADLRLNKNNITNLSCSSVKNFTLAKLKNLDLSQNGILKVDSCTFLGSTRIEFVNLSANSISAIADDSFTNVPSVRSLSLRTNTIESKSTDSFQTLANLEFLTLTENNLKDVPTSIKNLTKLKTLDVCDNPINVLKSDALEGLTGLENFFFRRLPNLKTIEAGALDNLPSLKTLAIEANSQLDTIPINTIPEQNLREISMLMLSNNGATKFDEYIFKSSPKLKIALIEGNPLFCDCSVKWMKQVMEDTDTYPWAEEWKDSAGPACDAPKPMKKMLISSIAEHDLTCDSPVVEALSPEDTKAVVGDNVTLEAMMSVGIPLGTWFNPAGLPLKPGDNIVMAETDTNKMDVVIREERLQNNSVLTQAILTGVTTNAQGQYTLVVKNADKGTAITFYLEVSKPTPESQTPVKVNTEAPGPINLQQEESSDVEPRDEDFSSNINSEADEQIQLKEQITPSRSDMKSAPNKSQPQVHQDGNLFYLGIKNANLAQPSDGLISDETSLKDGASEKSTKPGAVSTTVRQHQNRGSESNLVITIFVAVTLAIITMVIVGCVLLRKPGRSPEYTKLVNMDLGPTKRTSLYSSI